MRWLGLDYGDRKIGVALSDEFGWTAQGLEVISNKDAATVLAQITRIIEQYEVKGIVVGLPKNMNGSVGPRAEICITFAVSLREAFKLPVHLWDERLTTVSAERTLIEADVSRKKRKLVIDKLAASLILQGYLNSISTK
ncbi:MAG: Holliday junction resolvase RuvX [Paenibacillaceae bacterium]